MTKSKGRMTYEEYLYEHGQYEVDPIAGFERMMDIKPYQECINDIARSITKLRGIVTRLGYNDLISQILLDEVVRLEEVMQDLVKRTQVQ